MKELMTEAELRKIHEFTMKMKARGIGCCDDRYEDVPEPKDEHMSTLVGGDWYKSSAICRMVRHLQLVHMMDHADCCHVFVAHLLNDSGVLDALRVDTKETD